MVKDSTYASETTILVRKSLKQAVFAKLAQMAGFLGLSFLIERKVKSSRKEIYGGSLSVANLVNYVKETTTLA